MDFVYRSFTAFKSRKQEHDSDDGNRKESSSSSDRPNSGFSFQVSRSGVMDPQSSKESDPQLRKSRNFNSWPFVFGSKQSEPPPEPRRRSVDADTPTEGSKYARPRRTNTAVSIDPFSEAKQNVLQKPYRDVWARYTKGRLIGSGAYGSVTRCVDRLTGDEVACKTVEKSRLRCVEDVEAVRIEVRALEAVGDHPCIVSLNGTYEDQKAVHMVMELCKGGELFNVIQRRNGLAEGDAALICRQLASALSHCHSRGVVHRDVKPENIMLLSRNSFSSVRLVDFGNAGFMKPGSFLRDMVGTASYVAPEVLLRYYGRQVDLWSLGMTVYALLTSSLPFDTYDKESIFKLLESGKFKLASRKWNSVSEEARDLVTGLLERNPSERLTTEQVKEHPWIRRYCDHLPRHPKLSIEIIEGQE